MILAVCLAYSAGIPILLPIGAVSFLVFYWVEKALFVHFYLTPPQYSGKLTNEVIRWGENNTHDLFFALRACSSFRFVLKGRASPLLHVSFIVMDVASIYPALVPHCTAGSPAIAAANTNSSSSFYPTFFVLHPRPCCPRSSTALRAITSIYRHDPLERKYSSPPLFTPSTPIVIFAFQNVAILIATLFSTHIVIAHYPIPPDLW